jgi:hypothetical protein
MSKAFENWANGIGKNLAESLTDNDLNFNSRILEPLGIIYSSGSVGSVFF